MTSTERKVIKSVLISTANANKQRFLIEVFNREKISLWKAKTERVINIT